MGQGPQDRGEPGENEPPSAPGDILAGKYRVEKVLGVGGMGKVVSAIHVDLNERRAIKFMLATHLGDAEAVERFLREARASARLTSEHVVKVHDVGRLENGAPYMVMEYLRGADLGAELQRRGPFPPGEAALYMLQVCEALAEAHAAGIVHRDLKPENLFVTQDKARGPWVKVLDFGISKVTSSDPSVLRMTRTTAIMGSPYYMSPEQARASYEVDPRADIWSLGVVFYQLVTGQIPFDGKNLTEILSAVMFKECPRPSSIVPGLPRHLDRVILRCLEKDRERRYASIAELADDLAPLTPGGGRHAARTALFSIHAEDSISAGAVSSDPAAGHAGARRSPWRMVALGAVVSVVVLGGAFLVGRSWGRNDDPVATGDAPRPPIKPADTLPASGVAALSAVPAVAPATTGEIPTPPASASAEAPALPLVAPPHPLSPLKKPPPRPVTSGTSSTPPPEPTGDPFGAGRR